MFNKLYICTNYIFIGFNILQLQRGTLTETPSTTRRELAGNRRHHLGTALTQTAVPDPQKHSDTPACSELQASPKTVYPSSIVSSSADKTCAITTDAPTRCLRTSGTAPRSTTRTGRTGRIRSSTTLRKTGDPTHLVVMNDAFTYHTMTSYRLNVDVDEDVAYSSFETPYTVTPYPFDVDGFIGRARKSWNGCFGPLTASPCPRQQQVLRLLFLCTA